jgi:preprotein translocase subunit SecE
MKKPTKKKKKRSSRKKNRSEAKTQAAQTEIAVPSEQGRPNAATVQSPIKREPAKREPEKRVDEKGGLFRYINVALQFLRESRSELKKVKWPTKKELLASTAMVIFLVLVVSLFLGLIDFGLIKIIRNIVG